MTAPSHQFPQADEVQEQTTEQRDAKQKQRENLPLRKSASENSTPAFKPPTELGTKQNASETECNAPALETKNTSPNGPDKLRIKERHDSNTPEQAETPSNAGNHESNDPATAQDDEAGKEIEKEPSQQGITSQLDGINEQVKSKQEEQKPEQENDRPMSLRDHFKELRKRLMNCFLFALLGFAVCYPFSEEIFRFLVLPLDTALPAGSKFQYTAAHEAFFVFMKVAFVSGIFLTSPLIFYQIWAFIAPGLYASEKVYILPVALASAIFFVSGAAFCYYMVFPLAFDFFMQYTNDRIIAMPTLRESFGFVLQLLVAFGLVFELPLFVFFLARIGLITATWMRKTRRYAILVIVIIAAILTPPDVISQLLMACPMLILYELSIYVAEIFGKKTPLPSKTSSAEGNEERLDSN